MQTHAFDYIAQCSLYLSSPASRVLTVGARDASTLRAVFPMATIGALVRVPSELGDVGLDAPADLGVCAGLLARGGDPRAVLVNVAALVRPGGGLVVTAGGDDRPAPTSAAQLVPMLEGLGLRVRQAFNRPDRGDVYVYAEVAA